MRLQLLNQDRWFAAGPPPGGHMLTGHHPAPGPLLSAQRHRNLRHLKPPIPWLPLADPPNRPLHRSRQPQRHTGTLIVGLPMLQKPFFPNPLSANTHGIRNDSGHPRRLCS